MQIKEETRFFDEPMNPIHPSPSMADLGFVKDY